MSDSFADAPKTITELRADRSGFAKDMTVRDAVICVLRDLDAGKLGNVEFVAICFARRTENGTLINEYCGGKHDGLQMIGLLEQCKHRLLGDIAPQ